MRINSPYITGSATITGNLCVQGTILGTITGVASTASYAETLDGLDSTQFVQTGSFNSYTSSASSSLGDLSGSVATTTSGLSSSIGSLSSSVATTTSGLSSSIGSLSGSVATTTSGLGGRITTIEGRYATTGSNTFVGSQVITGSLYITNDMVVQGCSCLQNITASAVSIGTNTVMLNTATPAVRFAGISVQDSGSNAGVTGSIYWDGLCNRWIYSNPSGIGYSGGMLLSGPRTSTLGSESPLTCNYIAKSGGGDHLYDSCIYEMSGSVGINCSTPSYNLDVNGCGRFSDTLRVQHPSLWGAIELVGSAANQGGQVDFYGGTTRYATITGEQESTNNGQLIYRTLKSNVLTNALSISSTGVASFAGAVCVPNIISTGASGGRYGTFSAPANGGYITFDAGGTAFGDLGSYCAQYGTGDATTLLLGSRTGYALALGTNSVERMRITACGNVGIGTNVPASLLSAYNTTSTAISQMYISGPASNGTGGGNRGFDTSFTSTVTSFTGTDNGDQGYGYFPLTIVNGQTYTIHFKSTAVNGTLGTIITSTGTNFATDSVQTISLPTITDGALTSIRFTATGAATYIGFAGYRTSGTMSLTISEVSIVSGIPDIETGAIVAYKGVATNRINIQAPTTACIPVLGCADCTTGLIISNFDTRYGMLLGSLNTGTGWIQQGRYDGTATSYPLSLNPNGGNVGIGTTSPNLSGGASGTNVLTISATSSARNALLELNGTRTNSTDVTGYIRFFNNSAATPIADIRALRGSSDTWGDLAFTTCDTERMRIGNDGFVGINCSCLGSRTFVVRSINSRAITAEFIEQAGQHSLYIQPNKNSTNHISSDYVSSNVYLPLSLSGRECTTDLVLGINGNVGINNSNPLTMLQVALTPNAVAKTRNTCFGSCGIVFLSGLQGTTDSEVGIFGGNDFGSLSAGIGMARANSGNWDTHLRFYTHISSTDGNPADITEKMRITGDNVILMGTTSTSPTNSGGMIFRPTNAAYGGVILLNHSTTNNVGSGFLDLYYNTSYIGGIQQNGASAVLYNTSSDYRIKEDLKDFNGLEKISAIKVYDFKWKTEDTRSHGVIAHELQELLPYAVGGEKDQVDEYGKVKAQGVDYGKLTPILIKAIQEQQCIICSQSSMINTLKTCLGIM